MIKMYEEFSKKPEIKEEFYENGQKKSEYWYLNGKRHREDGPAVQWWHENGQIKFESWFLNDLYHRENGPSYQEWYANGQKKIKIWYLNGKKHREDGPSIQWWYENGQKSYEYWYLNDKEYYLREEWINELKKIGSEHYEEQKMLYDMEKYNL